VVKVQAWLKECVNQGRFLAERSNDRKELQSLVSFWTSLLRQHGYEVLEIGRLASFDPAAGVPLEVDCPYPGLKAYDENRQADFIGREKDTEDCVAHLEANRILMIVGGSGSGKSSLALAGVLPRLKKAHTDWHFVPPFIPGAKPFESLGKALAKALENSSDALTIAESLYRQPERAAVMLSELFGADKPVMLLIDQFEELLTLCQDEQEQKAFSELLYGLITRPDGSDDNNNAQVSACRILLTLRTDHLARFETNPLLRDLYRLVSNKNTKQLAAIDFEGIRKAIEEPAKNIGLRFLPPTIIDKLASQSASLVDGLPLLQFALQRLWEDRPTAKPRNDENGNKIEEPLPRLDFINEESFNKLPDVQNALGKVAENVYLQFDKEKQNLCERLMLELVLLDENFEQPLRRRRSKAELLQILFAQGWLETTVKEVIDVFVKQGLLRYGGGSEAQQLEVAHEAMFRNWSTFREWISGEGAKTRLHAVKLVGREALDWRAHKKSPDYLKLAGEPLESAQKYVQGYWLVDKDSTDYVEACSQQEQGAKQAKELAKKDKIARIQAEKEQAKAEAEKLEALREIEIAEANAKAQKWFGLAGLAFVIIAVSVAFWIYKEGQKSAALIALPFVTSKLPSSESLDVTYSVAKNGGKDFRHVLAHDLERMEDRYLFSPRKSDIVIAGQGTAIFQFNNSNKNDQKIRVFRVCEDGRVDNSNFAEIPYQSRQLVIQFVDIAPPNNQPGANDDRLLILPFKREAPQRGWDVEVSRLNWQNEPCAALLESEKDPKKPEVKSLDSAKKSLNDVDDISSMAFDASGENVAFSAISYQAKQPSSKVWALNGIAGKWTPVPIESKTSTINEDVVSAVAFKQGEPKNNLSTEQLFITGRLNGALYCGNKRFEKDLDETPVRQISTNHSKFGTEGEPWFVYRHESGKVITRQCNSTKEEEISFTEGNKENISFISINYINAGAEKQIKPVITFVNDRQPNCWIKEEKWTWFDCSSARFVKQFAIAPDAKHLVDVEVGGESVLKFPQEFLSNVRKQWVGRLSGQHLIVWPNGPVDHIVDNKGKISQSNSGGITRFEVQPSPEVEILKAAISPAENYISWLEIKGKSSKIDLRIYDIKYDTYIESSGLLNFEKDNIKTFDLAVTDNGWIVLAINDTLRLFKLNGETLKEDPLPIDQAKSSKNGGTNISCLELSPDNKKLVIGTKGGNLQLYNLTGGNFGTYPEIPNSSSVNACAVDDSGTIVGGYVDGSVWVVKADSVPFQLSPQAVYQFNASVKAVSIDSQQAHIAALSNWQTSGCTANGLPGQSIRIWGDLENKEQRPPLISNICLPNRRVITIGSIKEQKSELILPIAFDDGVELMPCRGCANKSKKETVGANRETPTDVFERLLKEAENKKAQKIEPKELMKRYGIKF